MEQEHFADRLLAEVDRKRSHVVVGLDPRVDLLPAELRPEDGDDVAAAAEAVAAFNRLVIDAVSEHAVAVKPQAAFYERLGCPGMEAFARTIRHARERGLPVIADAKRNDIASTAAAYAAAYLGGGAADDFVVDAVTVNPYLGADGVLPFVEAAAKHGRGVFVLVKTSNPSSVDVQDLECGGRPLYRAVGDLVERWGAEHRGERGYSLVGAVVGAPFPAQLGELRAAMPHTLFLIPGYGAQGAGVEEVVPGFDAAGSGAVVNSSRGVIFAWRQEPYAGRYGEGRWREAVAAAAAEMRAALWAATH
jgi:orotidine-5'-phosphate decarboxylase